MCQQPCVKTRCAHCAYSRKVLFKSALINPFKVFNPIGHRGRSFPLLNSLLGHFQ